MSVSCCQRWELGHKHSNLINTDLKNPFGPVKEENLRWHIEERAMKDPYDTSKNKSVKGSLSRYVYSLTHELFSHQGFVCHIPR